MEKDFKESIADFAKVPFDDVHILGIKQGSVIIDFKVNFKSAYGDENDASTTDDNKNEENSSSSSSSSSSGLKESAENIDNNIDNNNNNNDDDDKSEYPPHLTINKSQEAFTNALRVEQPSVIFKNAKTRIMQNSKVSLLALEDLQENSIQAWRNDIESAFINVTVTDIIDDENDYNNNTLIHEEEEHQQENNATKKTPSFVEHVESFYEANEENVQKAGFAATVALFLLLVYCVWKRLRRRRIGRGGTSRGGKSAAEKKKKKKTRRRRKRRRRKRRQRGRKRVRKRVRRKQRLVLYLYIYIYRNLRSSAPLFVGRRSIDALILLARTLKSTISTFVTF